MIDKNEVNSAGNYIYDVAVKLKQYFESDEEFIKAISLIKKEELEKVRDEYAGTEKIKLIRYEITDYILKNGSITLDKVNQTKKEVADKYSKNILQSWNNFRILFGIYYHGIKKDVVSKMNLVADYINENLEKNGKDSGSKAIKDFDWNQNFGIYNCWIALFPKDKKSFKEAYQLSVHFEKDSFLCGLGAGDKIKDFPENREKLEKFDIDRIVEIMLSEYDEYRKLNDELEEKDLNPNEKSRNYFWITANPKIWSVEAIKDGGTVFYTAKNNDGKKRRIYKNFNKAKSGDKIVFYESTPIKNIVAIGEISEGIHKENEIGFSEKVEGIRIKHIEDIKKVSWEELSNIKELKNCTPIRNGAQGSLFEITKKEFEILINYGSSEIENNLELYTKQDALHDLFLPEKSFDKIIKSLKRKKNIILQGPPGVGKTFIAKRLAYTLIGEKDEDKVQMIQFHQNYTYEDFILGFRPTEEGKFALKNGVFYNFCQKAKNSSEPHIFIIDEINRGNLSKIFGELMLLIERDKRGKEYSIPLTYSENLGEKFYIPENIYIIGTMNTADRSLSIVDYALRRRFAFINIEPQFNEKFRENLIEKEVSEEFADKLLKRIKNLNNIIIESQSLGKGYKIGHSYFTPIGEVEDEYLWYQEIIENEITSLIEEYWFDDEENANEQIENLKIGE